MVHVTANAVDSNVSDVAGELNDQWFEDGGDFLDCGIHEVELGGVVGDVGTLGQRSADDVENSGNGAIWAMVFCDLVVAGCCIHVHVHEQENDLFSRRAALRTPALAQSPKALSGKPFCLKIKINLALKIERVKEPGT